MTHGSVKAARERKTGTSASVVQVRDRKSNKLFAAKELFYKSRDPITSKKEWEALGKELYFIQQAKHKRVAGFKVSQVTLGEFFQVAAALSTAEDRAN
ncbi:unnamed protein product [Clonostachys chloroleuca]|uniref:Uncharacterized protein n=1 Tax=Clonostachys chloroleuca TaxID=1926264 RepID=A0AA35QCN0_9HYPO|nr:unnamed protein product [Clonostachys chloroleuca]